MKSKKSESTVSFSPALFPNDDIIITIGILDKGSNGVKGYPTTSRLRVWKRTRKGTYVQMGKIHKFKMMADSTKSFPTIEVTQSEAHPDYSALTKKALADNKQFFQSRGIKVVETKFKS